jgi:polysaccharide export outer membrane protein
MAEGPTPTANLKEARIIKSVPGSTRVEIALNLKDIQSGKAKDMMMQPEDILYIPDNETKRALRNTINTVLGMLPGLAIYR